MSRLYLYGIFHGNLSFSYIPKDLYGQIIERCYWPLLEIIQNHKIPFGLELPAYTLQMINRIDPKWVQKLAELWEKDYCQFIGSGYIQSIMPLIPHEANNKNLHYGNEVYKTLLGRVPNMAFVNEQVFSKSLPSIYKSAGYDSLVVNWDSALPLQSNPDLKYKTCRIKLDDSNIDIPILWHYTAAYRHLQNYIEKKSSLSDYTSWLNTNIPASGYRTLAFYSSDWEVFDFKPWDSYPDGFESPYQGEMDRLSGLIDIISNRNDVTFISPNEAINIFKDKPVVNPSSSANPLPYKKQDQHGMLRWAVGGRDAVRFNTQCYQLYNILITTDAAIRNSNGNAIGKYDPTSELWRELCYLWSSDFRTFTTEEKNMEFRNRMGAALYKAESIRAEVKTKTRSNNISRFDTNKINQMNLPVKIYAPSDTTENYISPNRTLEINDNFYQCQIINDPAPAGYTSLMSTGIADIYNLYDACIVKTPQIESINPPFFHIDSNKNTIQTESVKVILDLAAGGRISEISFPNIVSIPIITNDNNSTKKQDNTADINILNWDGDRLNDCSQASIIYPDYDSDFRLFVPILCRLITDFAVIWKTYRIYFDIPRIDINIRLQLKDLVPKSFRLGEMVFNTKAFDLESLHYITTNGGSLPEQFNLNHNYFDHGEPMDYGVTARTSIGASEGWVVISDSKKGVGLITDQTSIYSVPLLSHTQSDDGTTSSNLSVSHSLDEHDPTSHTLWRGHTLWNLSIIGGNTNITELTKTAARLINRMPETVGESSFV